MQFEQHRQNHDLDHNDHNQRAYVDAAQAWQDVAYRPQDRLGDPIEEVANGPDQSVARIEYAKGSHERPLSREQLWDKFTDCLGAEYSDDRKSHAFENLMAIDRLNGAGDLVSPVQ